MAHFAFPNDFISPVAKHKIVEGKLDYSKCNEQMLVFFSINQNGKHISDFLVASGFSGDFHNDQCTLNFNNKRDQLFVYYLG